MPLSTPRCSSSELEELARFADTLSLTEDQESRFQELVERLETRIEVQRRSIQYLTRAFREIKRIVKLLNYDLASTKLERDQLSQTRNLD